MFGKPVQSESLELKMESGGEGAGEHSASSQNEQTAFDGLKKFQRFKPTILGAIEVTIGIVMALTAIAYLAIKIDFAIIAIIYWGIFVYIPAGAMTIATDKKLTKAMVWGALVMNVLVALAAIAGSVLHFFASILFAIPPCGGSCGQHANITELVMLVLSTVLFLVSILVVASAVAAQCSSRKQSK